MATLTEIRQRLAETIAAGVDKDTNVKWYRLAPDSSVPLDRIWIETASVENTATQDQDPDAVFTVVVEVGGQTEETCALRLDKLLDRNESHSLFQVIEADRTLGGLVDDVNPRRAEQTELNRVEFEVAVMFT